jgi:2-hydroxy-6-oxonona-2,4-dienedioate hydrolase
MEYQNLVKSNPPPFVQTYVNVGHGSPVVLLNGLFGNLSMWQPLVEHLKKDFRVIVPRLPIFDLPIQHNSMKHLTKVLHEFIEWNQLTNVTLVGHAVGGQLALFYAHHHPDKIDKLILTGSSGLIDHAPIDNTLEQKEINYDFISTKVQLAFYDRPEEAAKLAQEIYLNVRNIPQRLAISSFVRSSLQSSVSSFLSQLTMPIQLIWGLQDTVSPPEVALHFHDLLLHAEVKFIDRCGHFPMMEQTDEFNNAVSGFLKGRTMSK